VKVFISSVIVGLESLRTVARDAAELFGAEVIQAERFPAQATSPQKACLHEARDADVIILVLGARYGEPQSSGLSATHEEYRAARESNKVLVFVEEGIQREPRQQEFLGEVQNWERGHLTKSFADTEDLQRMVVQALRAFEVGRAGGVVDDSQLLERAHAEVKHQLKNSERVLLLVIATGPSPALLRPAELQTHELGMILTKELLFSDQPLFDVAGMQNPEVKQGRLVLSHKDGMVTLDQAGTTTIRQPAEPAGSGLRPIVEEDVQMKLANALRFAAAVLDLVDPSQRASAVLPLAALSNPTSWTTQSQREKDSGHVYWKSLLDFTPVTVQLIPATQRRATLRADGDRLALDLTMLFRAKFE
jgi:Domain of unknown function (DUF4062)